MPNTQFDTILKAVSRSFYLSIRVLPVAMREPVAIAYLLARAADAIADTAILNEKKRLQYLLNFRQSLLSINNEQFKASDTLINSIDHVGERELLLHLSAIIKTYYEQTPADLDAVKKVVTTLTIGMEKDLEYFTNTSDIKALPDTETLDEYTYYVAGCVGEFWTNLSIRHTTSLTHWQQTQMIKLGVEFGKALQLTNILRDIAKDTKIGRCYLPLSDLNKYNLDTNMLFDQSNNKKFQPVILKWLQQADTYFDSAQSYLLSIPRHCLRLRLAALWPILIGLATLKLIKQKQNYLDANVNIKVERKWVYKMLLLSFFAVFSNTILHYWIKSIRNIHST
ncbi:MAG: squalene/phytoene synthase family protein [Gammaproteobacteria bacterium]|nr:squalene/phytoene synthase family protein [Gammaproteobacteria bacterium]